MTMNVLCVIQKERESGCMRKTVLYTAIYVFVRCYVHFIHSAHSYMYKCMVSKTWSMSKKNERTGALSRWILRDVSENVSGVMSINWTRVRARVRVFVHVDGREAGEIGSLLWF